MSETVTTRPRTLEISVLRHNPSDPASTPRLEHFEIEEAEGMTLFIALNEIRENQDPTLQFDFVCRAGICGACGMLIDGRPGLACRTLTRDLGSRVTLAPLPVFRLIGDLSVDTGAWMQGMAERLVRTNGLRLFGHHRRNGGLHWIAIERSCYSRIPWLRIHVPIKTRFGAVPRPSMCE